MQAGVHKRREHARCGEDHLRDRAAHTNIDTEHSSASRAPCEGQQLNKATERIPQEDDVRAIARQVIHPKRDADMCASQSSRIVTPISDIYDDLALRLQCLNECELFVWQTAVALGDPHGIADDLRMTRRVAAKEDHPCNAAGSDLPQINTTSMHVRMSIGELVKNRGLVPNL